MLVKPLHVAASLALGLGTGAATAQDTATAEPTALAADQVIDALDDATLRALLTQLSASVTPLDEEATTLRIAFPNGVIAIARRMACTGQEECKGLMLTAYLPVPDEVPAKRAEEVRRRSNLESLVATVVVNQLGEHVVKTYVILDGGITVENLAIWIGLFSESARAYQEKLYVSAP